MNSKRLNASTNLEQSSLPQPRIILTLIIILAAGLYLYKIGDESLWIDELYSVYDAKYFPNTFVFERPLYYIILKAWMLINTSEEWMRSLSVLFGLGSVFLIYRLGRKLSGEFVGLISALLLAFSPLCINFGQMVRMYEMAMFLGLGGSFALTNAIEKPTNFSTFRWAILRILMLLTTPVTATLLISDMIIIAYKFRRQPRFLWMFFRCLLLIFSAFTPFLMTTINTRDLLNHSPGFSLKLDTIVGNAVHTIGLIFRSLKKFTAFPFPSNSKATSLFYQGYSFVLWFLLVIAFFNKQRSIKLFFLVVWALIPSAITLLLKPGLFATDRYILLVVPYFLIILAIGFKKVLRAQPFWAILIAILYLLAVSGGLLRYYTVQDRQDLRGILQEISNHEQPGDMAILGTTQFGGLDISSGISRSKNSTQTAQNLNVAFNKDLSQKTILALNFYYKGSVTWQKQKRVCKSYKDLISSLEPMPNRIWLICDRNPAETQNFKEQISKHFDIQSHKKFTNWGFSKEDSFLHLFLLVPNSQD